MKLPKGNAGTHRETNKTRSFLCKLWAWWAESYTLIKQYHWNCTKKCFDQDGKPKKTSRKHKITPWFSQNMGLKPRRFNQKTGTYSAGGNHQQNMGFKQQKLSFNQSNDGNWVFWTFESWSCSKYDMIDTDVSNL